MGNVEENIKKFNPKAKKKSKSKKVFWFVLFAIFLGVAAYLLFNLSSFNITEIEVQGNDHYLVDEIIEKSNIKIGENIFGQAIFTKTDGVSNLPYIDSTKFEIKLPSKLVIKVVERTSAYYALDKEKNVYYRLSKNGEILELADAKKDEEITLTGISFDDEVKFGEKINELYLEKLKIYEKIKSEYDLSGISGKVTKVSFENSLTTLVLNDKLSVIFPNLTNLKYNIAVLKEILKNIGEDSSGVIDLNKENSTFSNF